MIARSFAPSFALDAALKDAGLIIDAAGDADVDLAMTEAVRRHLARAADLGHGGEDMARDLLRAPTGHEDLAHAGD